MTLAQYRRRIRVNRFLLNFTTIGILILPTLLFVGRPIFTIWRLATDPASINKDIMSIESAWILNVGLIVVFLALFSRWINSVNQTYARLESLDCLHGAQEIQIGSVSELDDALTLGVQSLKILRRPTVFLDAHATEVAHVVRIKADPAIVVSPHLASMLFENPKLAASILAHELGHIAQGDDRSLLWLDASAVKLRTLLRLGLFICLTTAIFGATYQLWAIVPSAPPEARVEIVGDLQHFLTIQFLLYGLVFGLARFLALGIRLIRHRSEYLADSASKIATPIDDYVEWLERCGVKGNKLSIEMLSHPDAVLRCYRLSGRRPSVAEILTRSLKLDLSGWQPIGSYVMTALIAPSIFRYSVLDGQFYPFTGIVAPLMAVIYLHETLLPSEWQSLLGLPSWRLQKEGFAR